MLYEQFGELKYKYRKPRILVQGVLCGHSREKREPNCGYVRNQLKEDEMGEQLRIPSNSPFTGGKSAVLTQLADPYYALHASARNKGLCPHGDNHQLRWWLCSLF